MMIEGGVKDDQIDIAGTCNSSPSLEPDMRTQLLRV